MLLKDFQFLFCFFRSLDACGCNKITDKGVCFLAKRCTKLTILDLSSTKVTCRRYAFYSGFSNKYQNVKASQKYFMITTLYIGFVLSPPYYYYRKMLKMK